MVAAGFRFEAGLDHFDRHQCGCGVDDGGDVGLAFGGGEALKGLRRAAGAMDDEGEGILFGVAHLYLDGVAAGASFASFDIQRVPSLFVASGQQGCGRHGQVGVNGLAQRLDADDVAATAAVLKVAIDGVGQVGARDKAAELLYVLAPVGDQRWFVQQGDRCAAVLHFLGLVGKADEGSYGGAYGLDRPRATVYLFDVNTWGKILGHFITPLRWDVGQ